MVGRKIWWAGDKEAGEGRQGIEGAEEIARTLANMNTVDIVLKVQS